MLNNYRYHFLQHDVGVLNLEQNDPWRAIWFATVWSLWLARNNMIYCGGKLEVYFVFEVMELRSWSWLTVRDIDFQSSLFEWTSGALPMRLEIE